MPKPFTKEQKETIRAKLMEVGRTCFIRFGLKKTTLDDLVKPAGIAKASFYLFFDSKESLYIDILLAEMPAMMDRLISGSFGATDDTRSALALLVKGIAEEVSTNPFSRVMLDNPEQLQQLASKQVFQDVLERATLLYAPLLEMILAAQSRGDIIKGDPQQVLFSLGLVKLLALNRDSLPDGIYESLIDFVPQVIAAGLTSPSMGATTYNHDANQTVESGSKANSTSKDKR